MKKQKYFQQIRTIFSNFIILNRKSNANISKQRFIITIIINFCKKKKKSKFKFKLNTIQYTFKIINTQHLQL